MYIDTDIYIGTSGMKPSQDADQFSIQTNGITKTSTVWDRNGFRAY
jgi:hypothetical protein